MRLDDTPKKELKKIMFKKSDIMTYTKTLQSLEQTIEFAAHLSKALKVQDIVACAGDIGAGKSTLCRAIIQNLCGSKTIVPSPTFTLIQVYEAPLFDIWHCDFYRLTAPDEALELGLDDAFHDALCLIEWPQALGTLLPQDHIHLHLKLIDDTKRALVIKAPKRYAPLIDHLKQEKY